MNTHDIAAFVAVVDTGSIVAAAKQLHLTQPGVSRRIQSLETQLGVELLDRLSKPLKPTGAGREVYGRGRQILASVADLVASTQPDAEVSGDFRMGVPPFLAEQALSDPIDALRRDFPRLTPRVVAGWSPDLVRMVVNNTLDAAAILAPDNVNPPDSLATHFLGRELPLIVAARDIALPHTELSLAKITQFPWVLNQDGCGPRSSIRRASESAHLPF
uniref:LysR family transcriptional regulator n=1 Tax=Undibacterium sp. TaxID=1914977 RepID=UPI00374CA71D